MIMTLIYRALVGIILVFVVWNMFSEKKLSFQVTGALIVIPLILRLFMIK